MSVFNTEFGETYPSYIGVKCEPPSPLSKTTPLVFPIEYNPKTP